MTSGYTHVIICEERGYSVLFYMALLNIMVTGLNPKLLHNIL